MALEKEAKIAEAEMNLMKQKQNLDLEKRKLEVEREQNENRLMQEELEKIEIFDGLSMRDQSVITKSSEVQDNNKVNGELLDILRAQNDISSKLVNNQEKSCLPKTNIDPFDGEDALKFKHFISAFERTIENKCKNFDDKFLYLLQFTKGEANSLVQSCSHFNPQVAYIRAKQKLLQEYDNEYLVSHTYISKLKSWTSVKSGDLAGLQKLSLFLSSCNNYFQNMSTNNQLNNPVELMNIVMKLHLNRQILLP